MNYCPRRYSRESGNPGTVGAAVPLAPRFSRG
jgi:hypothetical protein